jgi:hypothetical protein
MGAGLRVPSLAHNVALGATTVTITPATGFVIESALDFFLGDGGPQHGGRRPQRRPMAQQLVARNGAEGEAAGVSGARGELNRAARGLDPSRTLASNRTSNS